MKKFLSLTLIHILWIVPAKAQGDSLDFLRSTGKIYSVVAVIAVIFIGITIFLYRLDRKLTKLENQINNEQ
ncbi:MAG: CcmD family protein [Saprospiraceae bacterium]|nr:CcmD family protein [Saprospiraceae bacterium]